ncbi:hypothetical protein ACFYPK_33155, partial [Streptomyces halstedii]|uniref:hypothetical protein n=1 Tax=Streptomyces halstedii TaxID=1944 RepID=UPI0036896129
MAASQGDRACAGARNERLRELHSLPEFRLRNSIPALAPEFELRLRNSFTMTRLAGAYPAPR